MTISVNEQVAGHKVTVRPAARIERGQRRASCQCGWQSRIGSTEQVMPEIRTHLEAALAAAQPPAGPPTKPGSRSFRPWRSRYLAARWTAWRSALVVPEQVE